jgi:hypothetical protein
MVTDDQARWLDSRPHAAHEVVAYPRCELEEGHPGPHAALAQQDDGVEWWLCWTTQTDEPAIVERRACPIESDTLVNEHGEHEPCLLFEEHPGRHSFELA